ncbi:MAG: dTDP-4-dehydrorhamnose reductase [Candidatus Gottesmanbacteria bacterium GW2011_GWC2_39_8]|uniref:dTDP-4-dehydrorhamnose reductase n=1 Tax=Candidatus Gottesmanbacteria bacterium GW2011_GWC2_39_8 TaxID=1618450 RepID=A0A0G0Q2I4_9BACT|nr:MAG: dTDP-4-dehydrorhamnose reductase [Candidatus Gottesmanbacteria bacterium GW2011_GWC2_39_8]
MKQKVMGTGLTGLVGSRIVEILGGIYDFENLSLSSGVDITNYDQLLKKLSESSAKIIIHLAAKADTEGCENDRILGENGAAWKINVAGTKNVAETAHKTGKKIIYFSTDFVFDGTKDFYTEEDIPNPVNWYGVTKYEGEKFIDKEENLIVRIAYPYRATFLGKKDFVRNIINLFKAGKPFYSVTDATFTPTFIDDIASAIDILIEKDVTGIFHVVGSESISPIQASSMIAETFGLDLSLILPTMAESFYKGKRTQPLKLVIKNDRIKKLGAKMHGFADGLSEIKHQLS